MTKSPDRALSHFLISPILTLLQTTRGCNFKLSFGNTGGAIPTHSC